MTFNLYLLHNYNNYFNRIVKKELSLQDYINAVDDYFVLENVNFAIGDGVTTSHIINKTNNLEYDYCIVTDGDNNILSKWFIKENIKTRNSQWNINLKRDVIVDYFEKVTNSKMYIEKGWVDEENVLILNKENVELNQIKVDEKILKDKSNVAWIVGYFTNNLEDGGELTSDIQPPEYVTAQQIAEDTGISQTIIESMLTNHSTVDFIRELKFSFDYYVAIYSADERDNISWYANTNTLRYTELGNETTDHSDIIYQQNKGLYPSYFSSSQKTTIAREIAAFFANSSNDIKNLIKDNDQYLEESNYNKLMRYNNSIVRVGSDYKRLVIETRGYDKTKTLSGNVLKNAYQSYYDLQQYGGKFFNDFFNRGDTFLRKKVYTVRFQVQPYTVGSYKISHFPHQSHKILNDKPYSMFCMPYGEITIRDANDNTYTCETNSAIAIAKKMVHKFNVASNNAGIYDIQILPYCPVENLINEDNEIDLSEVQENYDYQLISRDNEVHGILFYCTTDSFTITINESIQPIESKKIVSNCDNWRICSPNYQGGFDFNVANNGGSVDYFVAYCTYKPYTPFIKVAPNFNYLYGREYRDSRGCICGGDFSITQLSNAWTTYELNNKNYQNIFNREIQNLEFTQGQEKIMSAFNIFGGIGQGLAGGAITGSKFGLGGAITGSAIGGAVGIAGGIADYTLMGERHKEQLDYAKDKFELQLGNIKAMPNTLTKVSSFDIISKIYPFLEYYTCTEEEKNYFKEKIKYEGMTLGIIGTLGEYITNEKHYFKGRLVRIEDLGEDNHIACDIYNELLKGVYL